MSDGEKAQLTFTEAEVDAIYAELIHLSCPLDNDPVSFGPKRLNAKTAEVRKMLDRVHRIYLDLSQKHGAAKRQLRRAMADLDLAKKDLFANDPMTRAGRNVADREAIATGKLREDVEEANRLQILESDLEALLTVVRAKHADLKDTESRLRDQVRLCGEELSLGSRWGSAVPNAPDLDHRVATGADVKEIDNLLARMNGQIDLAQQSGDFPSQHAPKSFVVKDEPEPFVEPEESFETPVVWVESQPVQPPVEALVDTPADVSAEPTPDPTPVVIEAADELLEEPPAKDLGEIFPAQVTQAAADAFLETTVIPTPSAKPQSSKTVPREKDLDLDDLLSSFEDPNGR